MSQCFEPRGLELGIVSGCVPWRLRCSGPLRIRHGLQSVVSPNRLSPSAAECLELWMWAPQVVAGGCSTCLSCGENGPFATDWYCES